MEIGAELRMAPDRYECFISLEVQLFRRTGSGPGAKAEGFPVTRFISANTLVEAFIKVRELEKSPLTIAVGLIGAHVKVRGVYTGSTLLKLYTNQYPPEPRVDAPAATADP